MPVPKRQHSKSRTNRRAAGKHKIPAFAGTCSVCNAIIEQHAVCLGCGFYKGMKLMRTKAERKEERKMFTDAKNSSQQALAARRQAMAEAAAEKDDSSEE